jgi:hypothetical protein
MTAVMGPCLATLHWLAVADYKKIEDTVDKHLYDQMHLRLQTPYAKGMKKLRQQLLNRCSEHLSTLWALDASGPGDCKMLTSL